MASPSSKAPGHIRRFYFELVRHRRQAPDARPVQALSRAPLLDAIATMGTMAREAGVEVRVAALVELPEARDAALRPIAEAIAETASTLAERGVGLDVWPQLADPRTRFLNASTAARFSTSLLPLLDELERLGAPGLGLALDVEPSARLLEAAWRLSEVRRAPRVLPRATARVVREVTDSVRTGPRAIAALQRLERELSARGLPVHVAVMPPLVARRGGTGLRRWLLGCPIVDEAGRPLLGRPAPMCYVTMLRRAGSDRRLEQRALRAWAGRHARRFADDDEPLAVVLGAMSEGVLGDEPVYDEARELESDLALVLELGFRDVGFFSLEGLLFGPRGDPLPTGFAPARPDWEAWARAALRPPS